MEAVFKDRRLGGGGGGGREEGSGRESRTNISGDNKVHAKVDWTPLSPTWLHTSQSSQEKQRKYKLQHLSDRLMHMWNTYDFNGTVSHLYMRLLNCGIDGYYNNSFSIEQRKEFTGSRHAHNNNFVTHLKCEGKEVYRRLK